MVCCCCFFILPLGLLAFVFWIWMLISAIQNKGLAEGEKIAWVLVIALLHVLGAIIYFFVGHPKRKTPLTGLKVWAARQRSPTVL